MEFIFMLTRNDETLADAREVYASVAATGVPHARGRFGADMQVTLTNDGPVTFWLHV